LYYKLIVSTFIEIKVQMNKSIVIPQNQIGTLVTYYTGVLNAINEKLLPLQSEKEEVEAMLLQLTGSPIGKQSTLIAERKEQTMLPFDSTGFDKDFSIPKKIRFVLMLKKTPLTSIQIIDEIKKLDPDSTIKIQDLSTEISRAIANGTKYYREGENRMKYKYGLLEWKKEKVREVNSDLI
jgi:hypothetical protein